MRTIVSNILILSLLAISFVVNAERDMFSYDPENDVDKVLYNYFDDQNLEISYIEDTPINKLYIIRVLLNSPEAPKYFRTCINYINHLLRMRGLTPPAKQNLEKVNELLRKLDITSSTGRWFDIITGNKNVITRHTFLTARFFLNEAIMNSRIILNASTRGEKKFVEKLLANYFFPGMSDSIKIIYPKESVYSFDKWKLTSKILIDVLKLNRADQLKMEVIRGKSAFIKKFVGDLLKIIEDEAKKMEFIDEVKEEAVNNNIDPTVIEEITSGFLPGIDLDKDQTKILVQMLVAMYKGYASSNTIPIKDTNDTRHMSMLMQLIADPGVVSVDPQLRVFAENIKVEVNMGEDSTGDAKFFLESLQKMSKSELNGTCMAIDKKVGSASVDMNCLTGRSSSMAGMNRKSVSQLVFDMKDNEKEWSGKVMVRFITGIGGEDLERFRSFMTINKLAILKKSKEPIGTIARRIAWKGIVKLADNKESKYFRPIAGIVKSIGEKQFNKVYGQFLGGYDKLEKVEATLLRENFITRVWNKLDVWSDKKIRNRLDRSFEKINTAAASNTHKKIKAAAAVTTDEKIKAAAAAATKNKVEISSKIYQAKNVSRMDRMFNRIAVMGILVEGASLISDLASLENISEKRDSIAQHLGSMLTFRLYMIAGVGGVFAGLDTAGWALRKSGRENTPRVDEVISSSIAYMIAWGNGAPTPTALKAEEIELAYGLPLQRLKRKDYVSDYNNAEDKDGAYIRATSDTIDGFGRVISGLYFLHRSVNEYKVDSYYSSSFGFRIISYRKQVVEYLRSYLETMKEIRAVEVEEVPDVDDVEIPFVYDKNRKDPFMPSADFLDIAGEADGVL